MSRQLSGIALLICQHKLLWCYHEYWALSRPCISTTRGGGMQAFSKKMPPTPSDCLPQLQPASVKLTFSSHSCLAGLWMDVSLLLPLLILFLTTDPASSTSLARNQSSTSNPMHLTHNPNVIIVLLTRQDTGPSKGAQSCTHHIAYTWMHACPRE
jgi:hypothetical protein